MAQTTVSVLFTDLVESTELASRLGPAAAEDTRRAYFSALRDAMGPHGGTEVKTTGDGLMVVFASLAGALDGAVAMQQAIERHNRRADHPLRVRIGLSSGDAEEDDADYFGPPVVEASRLCDLADGGTILTTELVRLMAARTSHRFEPTGARELKGLPEPVTTCELQWEPGAAPAAVPLPARLQVGPTAGFVGRQQELAVLRQLLKEASQDLALTVGLISGEPGMGKTTLAAQVARSAHHDGTGVLYGRCDEELAIPYQPFIEAIGDLVDHAADVVLDRVGPSGLSELARLVPKLCDRRPDLQVPSRLDTDAERFVLFRAVTDLLCSAAEDAPLVLLLDDLHWADKPTVLLLRHLINARAAAPVTILVTYRSTELPPSHPLAKALVEFRKMPWVRRIPLRGLDDVEVVTFVEGMAGHEMDANGVSLAHALRRETEGNPFFTGELLRHLAESGQVQQQDGRWVAAVDITEIGLPDSVREVVGKRIQRLGGATLHILSQAAVIGRDFELGLLTRLVERPESEILDVLEEAAEADLVVEVPEVPDGFSFTHALVQHTLYDDLTSSRRRRAHRQVAELLEAECGDEPGDRVGELARHWLTAGRVGDPDRAATYAGRAGRRALQRLAPQEAARWFEQALELCPDRDRRRTGLLIGLGQSQRASGEAAYRETLLEAAAMARQLGEADLLVSAALANNRGWVSSIGAMDAERIDVLEAALDSVGGEDPATRARLLVLLATELNYGTALELRLRLTDEAVAIARELDDPATLLHVLLLREETIRHPSTLPQRAAEMAEAVELAEASGDPVAQFWAVHWAAMPAWEVADGARAEELLDQQDQIASKLGNPSLRWNERFQRATFETVRGDAVAGERLAVEAHRIGTEAGEPDADAIYGGTLTMIRRHQGRVHELAALAETTASEIPGLGAFRAILGLALLERDEVEGARELLQAAAANDFDDIPPDYLWLTNLLLWSEVASRTGDAEAARRLYELLLPWHEQFDFSGATSIGSVASHLGRLAAVLDDPEAAAVHFTEALRIERRFPAPSFEARTCIEWAGVLSRRGRPEHGARAVELLEEAVQLARRYDCPKLLAEAEAALG
jgi:class 3 adenylate cyclase/tetratricopeptide (TPR) repeat protein